MELITVINCQRSRSQSDHHEICVSILALESNPAVELDHIVRTVQGDFVAVEFLSEEDSRGNQELSQLATSVLIRHHDILHPPHLTSNKGFLDLMHFTEMMVLFVVVAKQKTPNV